MMLTWVAVLKALGLPGTSMEMGGLGSNPDAPSQLPVPFHGMRAIYASFKENNY